MLKANWIETAKNLGDVCPLFLKMFPVNKPLVRALLRISARGVYEARLNGKRVGEFIMAPGWTAYKARIQVQEYDVTGLTCHNNRLVVQLASGWQNHRGPWDSKLVGTVKLALIAELRLEYADGSEEIIGTDEDWLVSESGLRYCDLYDGLIYDATFKPCFTQKAVISEHNSRDRLIPQQGEEVIENERLQPAHLIKTPKGETVIDFGQNLTGYLEFTVKAKAGEKVSFSFAEILDHEGNFYNENYRSAKAMYDYTCCDGLQTYKPNLTFYGFRYVRVDAFPAVINLENFTAIVVHSRLRQTGRIETSDPMLNQLFHNILWSQKDNYLDIPTDCPQRDERLGWTGDAQVFIRTASYNFDIRRFFMKWLSDMKAEQLENGAIPAVIPAVVMGLFSPAWGDAVTICPWQLYLTYGDKKFLALMFDSMKKWVGFCMSDAGKTRKAYGDWLELKNPTRAGGRKGDTRDELITDAFNARSVELVCKTGRVLGQDVSEYESLYTRLVREFKEKYRNDFRTQTEYILPLYFGLCDTPEKTAAALVEMIHADGDKLQTGFVGTPYLLHVLSDYGYHDLAYTLLLRKEYPSWLYPVTMGATTIWEHWDGILPDGTLGPTAAMNSFNHYAYGAVGDWMYGVCAGINTVEAYPGFERVHFAPVTTDRIDWFSAEIETVHGTIKSKWHHENRSVVYEITTPVKATALIAGISYVLDPGTYMFRA